MSEIPVIATAADFMREGQARLAAGSPGPACIAFCQALDLEPRLAAAHYNLGAVLLMAGRAGDSLPGLMTAAMLQPGHAQITIALARSILENGERERAASLLAQACRALPENAALRAAAAQCPLAQVAPEKLDGFVSRVSPEAGNARIAEATASFTAGRFDAAFAQASPLVWIAPQSMAVWTLLAEASRALGRGEYAEFCVRRALAITPSDAQAWALLARLVGAAEGRLPEAERIWARVLELAPHNPDLIAEAAAFHDKSLDPAPMLALLEKAQADGVDFANRPDLLDALARALLRAGRLDEARAMIRQSLDLPGEPDQIRSRQFTLGAIEDKRGRYHQAHAAFVAGNRLRETVWEDEGPCDHTMITRRIESLHRRLNTEITSGQSVVSDADAGPGNIAFLVGFPRSGTTLLDTILRSHSRVRIVEEQRVLGDALRRVVDGMSGDESNFTEDWLDRLEDSDPAALRASYLEKMAHHAGERLDENRVYIDKLPLNMNWAPMIHKILPRAVFILARRHPLDVAISNLVQDFKPNNAMLNMTSLARIDRLYDLSFSLWQDFETWRRPRVAHVSYEALVDDLEASVTPVMRKLGLEFEPAQARFFETARQRGRINTPSANQVTQALYTTSRERWRNYAFALEGEDSAALRAWADH
ncbi:tetratricopeptide repeat-containing sulfotransferase family protein [Maricaulis sp.]|uniref:tetratricopeptide repeat-containing sulfotransferase family protein n=1 Tax=Maricaulis sp. TaxID=1486257 RepID=UPI003A8E4E30